ncbi:MAG: hypothetical protein AB9866_05425 [Syntrophobacteraceae bacterium]
MTDLEKWREKHAQCKYYDEYPLCALEHICDPSACNTWLDREIISKLELQISEIQKKNGAENGDLSDQE